MSPLGSGPGWIQQLGLASHSLLSFALDGVALQGQGWWGGKAGQGPGGGGSGETEGLAEQDPRMPPKGRWLEGTFGFFHLPLGRERVGTPPS